MKESLETIRTRLAMRESFFGGPLNTRDQSRHTGPTRMQGNSTQASSDKDKRAAARAAQAAKLSSKRPLPEPQIDPEEARRDKRRKNRDFSGLKEALQSAPAIPSKKKPSTETTADPPTGNGRPNNNPANPTSQQTTPPKPHPNAAARNNKPSGVYNVMNKTHRTTALGMQTLQLLTRKGKPPTPRKPTPPSHQRSRPSPGPNTKGNNNTLYGGIGAGGGDRNGKCSNPGGSPSNKVEKLRFKGVFYGSHQPPAALHKRRSLLESASESDSMLSDFIDDGDEYEHDVDVSSKKKGRGMGGDTEDWRSALKEALGGYDASKYEELDKMADRRMEASYEEIESEEAQAARIARAIDKREALLEAQRKMQEAREDAEEARAAGRERQRLKKVRKKGGGSSGFIVDDEDE